MIVFLEPHPSGGTCLVALTRQQAIDWERQVHNRKILEGFSKDPLTNRELLEGFKIVHWAEEVPEATLYETPDGIKLRISPESPSDPS